MDSEITLYMKEKGSRVAATDFLNISENFLIILKEVDTCLSRDKKVSHDWVIKNLRTGSAAMTLEAVPKDENNEYGNSIINTVLNGLRTMETSTNIPKNFNENVIKAVREIGKYIGKTLGSIAISASKNTTSISANIVSHADKLLNETIIEEYGEIFGVLKMITTVGKPYVNIYDSVTSRPVKCEFDGKYLKKILNAMENGYVNVSGLIIYDIEGYPKKIKQAKIEIMPPLDELPSLEDVISTSDKLFGGMKLKDLIERRNNERYNN